MVPAPQQLEIDSDASWELLLRVVNSNELKRSLRLRELLLYLGKRSLKSNVASIREQEIGAAVFGRPEDYDTGIDNIVRVNVSELRKRLAHYFQEEGAGEPIILEIPRGGYFPVFLSRPVEKDSKTQEHDPAPEPVTNVHVQCVLAEGCCAAKDWPRTFVGTRYRPASGYFGLRLSVLAESRASVTVAAMARRFQSCCLLVAILCLRARGRYRYGRHLLCDCGRPAPATHLSGRLPRLQIQERC